MKDAGLGGTSRVELSHNITCHQLCCTRCWSTAVGWLLCYLEKVEPPQMMTFMAINPACGLLSCLADVWCLLRLRVAVIRDLALFGQ